MSHLSVEIVEYSPAFAKDFARLNYPWIERYFSIEPQDRAILDHPEESIIQPGGQIFFAVHNGEAIGTVALSPTAVDTFELTKMCVTPEYKGQRIGKRLMLRAIEYAIKVGKRRLVILSNTTLTPALNLYLHFGFKPIAMDVQEAYDRANIKLEKSL